MYCCVVQCLLRVRALVVNNCENVHTRKAQAARLRHLAQSHVANSKTVALSTPRGAF